MSERRRCEVAVVGAGLSGLLAARSLVGKGVDVVVVEARDRVGGRTSTTHLDEATWIDDGGQWVSPNQDRIVALAAELGVELFPSWDAGQMVLLRDGRRYVSDGLFRDDEPDAANEAVRAAGELAAMAESVPIESPWTAPAADEWDAQRLHEWLAANVSSNRARVVLATAIEGVFARNATRTSLLAALYWAHCGDPLVPFTATAEIGSERRFVGGAEQLSILMAEQLGERVLLERPVDELDQTGTGVVVRAADGFEIEARRAIVTLPPALAGRLRYVPELPAARDHLCQRTPMRWVVKVHCVYPERFWAAEGLSGAAAADDGLIRTTADNSPPAGAPGILVGFVEETEAVALAGPTRESGALRCSRRSRSSTASAQPAPTTTARRAGVRIRSRAAPTAATGRRASGRRTATPSAGRTAASTGRAPRRPRPGTARWKARCSPASAPQPRSSKASVKGSRRFASARASIVRQLIDAHVHHWQLGRFRYSWLEHPDFEPLRADYLPADYRTDAAGAPIDGWVHVQAEVDHALDPVAEIAWVAMLAEEARAAEAPDS